MSETVASREQNKPPYTYRLVNIECLPQSDHYNVIMELKKSIEDLLPYCAAVLPGATYVHGSGVVNVMDQGHIVAIYGDRITITDVSGPEEASVWCHRYFEIIEQIRRERDRITPALRTRPSESVLDIYRILPKTNCGRCGVPTCLAFAAKVFRRESSLKECTEIQE
ncbi:MAG: (Fe-S)-binding protein [Desulfosoma sp.]